MQLLELSLDDPAANLALDEALLESAAEDASAPVLRLWEFAAPVVVLGRGSRVADEVDLAYCHRRDIGVFRRCSGGATVVGGPGCLMYSLVTDLRAHPHLRKLDLAHRYVMTRIQRACAALLPGVTLQGICDLTWGDRKFSGNSLRVTRHHLLYHGTVLYDADLEVLAGCLRTPPRQPDYRRGRDHRTFVTNVPLDPLALRQTIADAFEASERRTVWPAERVRQLCEYRYGDPAWNLRH